jgi:flagellar biosynthesis/type III secretory pathway M-ring protein FliF/YscJ
MEQLRRILAIVEKYLGGMTPSQKLLIGCLGVILLMTLFLVSQYAGRPNMVELAPGGTPEEQQRALSFLRTSHIKVEDRGGRVYVPSESQQAAFAILTEAGQQPANSALVFENILKTQNWLNTKEQNRQIYKVMIDNWLSGVISRFAGVKLARVFVDNPEPMGLGPSVRTPKASVTIFMEPGRSLPQETVDAAARLVAGSVAGLDLTRVTVTDGATGRPRRITLEDDMAPSTYREYAAAVEKQFRDKLLNLVRDIEGVVVEVTASVDVSRVKAQVSRNLPLNEGSLSVPKKESTTTTTESQASSGGEPGVRSNQSLRVNEGGGSGNRTDHRQEDTEFTTAIGQRVEQIEDPRGMPTHLVATVAVPRSFIVALLQTESGGEKGTAPNDASIEARFAKEEARLTKSLAPHVKTIAGDGGVIEGEVIVTLMSGPGLGLGGHDSMKAELLPGINSVGTLISLSSGMIDKVVLGVLALVSMGMMVLMVRKAGRHVAPPRDEVLAGAPPTLETKDDLVGEADESDTAMAGILVGEDELKSAKMREQVSELIRQSPDTALKVLNRWVSVEE